ncbi:MAG: class I SAM-dependent methyltransferase [Rhizobiales bacterium]|nr:class I SAM-dependent methyltransferase [Hyphomicrobiales bacterium]
MSDTSKENEERFEFGKNWNKFIKRNFSQERCDVSKAHILKFIGRDDLKGLDFLDIGCGSGLHSLAAFQSGAGKIHSLDYDPNSVETTELLHKYAQNPSNWKIGRGDVLDGDYVDGLGIWNFVYSWGVLHHTGDVWQAIRNAQSRVADGGLFYIALYAADVQTDMQFWLDVKREYNKSSTLKKKWMALWYVYRFGMDKKIYKLPLILKQIWQHRFERGMSYFADVHDWLGGWPMEFTYDQDVVDLLEKEHGFKLINVATGEACSEFLFERTGSPETPTNVKEMVGRAKKEAESAKANES